jgi:patatin-related protein
MEAATDMERQEVGETKQLRLAVVCYGGVSLAIYMHGQTKEINRLVKASALLDEGGDTGAGTGSERVYAKLLEEMAAKDPDRARTRVVVDTVAGTSAGGINGVYLAKAVAHNRSQDELRNLWIEKGDIGLLMRGPEFLSWKLRLPGRLLRIRKQTALRGDAMSEWLYEALDAMDKQARTPDEPETLMPPRHLLQLFVTMTDFYGYNREIVLMDPEPDGESRTVPISDWRHRHVLEFRHGPGRDDFASTDNAALAFSARATSCFPGAFPPVSFDAFEGYLRKWDVRFPKEFDAKYFRLYGLSEAVPRNAFFVDGGILDNRPFGHAIAAIRVKAADVEVDRRLLYLEPDPGAPGRPPKRPEPSPFSTVFGAISGIPRREPLLEDLLTVATFNDRVARVRDIIEVSFDKIAERVPTVIGQRLDELPADPGPELLGEWSAKVHEAAAQDAGLGYATYIRLKIGAVVDRYARAVCAASNFPEDSNQAFFVRTVMRSWAENGNLLEKATPPTPQQIDFLSDFDLEYGRRRIEFVIAGLNWFYRDRAQGKEGYPERADLDALKRRLYESVDTLRRLVAAIRDDEQLSGAVRACLAQKPIADFVDENGFAPGVYAARHAGELNRIQDDLRTYLKTNLRSFTVDLYRDLERLTHGWHPKRRADLLVRYLGFPFWDVLLYPIKALAEVGERDHLDVVRMSPRDSTLLGRQGEAKLKGIGRHHFGAFFERAGRENDYLWGRLDGAERLIGLLVGRDDPGFRAWCVQAFEAILDEEAEATPPLPAPLLEDLRGLVAKAGAAPAARSVTPP